MVGFFFFFFVSGKVLREFSIFFGKTGGRGNRGVLRFEMGVCLWG